jgi:hypothetical protein
MPRVSAGLLMYRMHNGKLQVRRQEATSHEPLVPLQLLARGPNRISFTPTSPRLGEAHHADWCHWLVFTSYSPELGLNLKVWVRG